MNYTQLQKRRDAEARQAMYNDLTTFQKIELVKSRRGDNTKELAKLVKRLELEKAMKVTKTIQTAMPVIQLAPEKKVRIPKSQVIKNAKAKRPSKS